MIRLLREGTSLLYSSKAGCKKYILGPFTGLAALEIGKIGKKKMAILGSILIIF